MKNLLIVAVLLGVLAIGCANTDTRGNSTKQSPASPTPPAELLARVKREIAEKKTWDASDAMVTYKTLNEIGGDSRDEAQKILRTLKPKLSSGVREGQRSNYEGVLATSFPSFNGIEVKASGGRLMGVHSFFNQYTFQIGSEASVVSTWISQNSTALKYAGIKKVGVRDREGYGGWTAWDVE